MKEIAKYGRNGDTRIGHLTNGEVIIPNGIINSKLQKELKKAFEKQGTNIERYTVGNSSNSINPITGQPEFFFKSVFRGVKKVFSGAAKVVKKAVKGVVNFVKSPAGMASLMLLGGAFMSGGGFASIFGGKATGMERFGRFLSTMRQGFSNITSPVRGLFGGMKTSGVTLTGEGFKGVTVFNQQALKSALASGAEIASKSGYKFAATGPISTKTSGFINMARALNKKHSIKEKVGEATTTKTLYDQFFPRSTETNITLEAPDYQRIQFDIDDFMNPHVTNIPISKNSVNLAGNLQDFGYNAYGVNSQDVDAESIFLSRFNKDINGRPAFGYTGGANRMISDSYLRSFD